MSWRVLDEYALKARYYPTIIVIAPMLCIFYLYFPNAISQNKFLISLVVGIGFLIIFEQVGRSFGKKKENILFATWGGIPTTRILYPDDGTIDKYTKARYLKYMEGALTNQNILNVDSELDVKYLSYAKYLKEKTRDKKSFPLLFQENMNYGFRRNLWGMRQFGILFSLLGLILVIIKIYLNEWVVDEDAFFAIFTGVISLFLFCIWIFVVNKDWVKVSAYDYANQLYASIDSPNLPRV